MAKALFFIVHVSEPSPVAKTTQGRRADVARRSPVAVRATRIVEHDSHTKPTGPSQAREGQATKTGLLDPPSHPLTQG